MLSLSYWITVTIGTWIFRGHKMLWRSARLSPQWQTIGAICSWDLWDHREKHRPFFPKISEVHVELPSWQCSLPGEKPDLKKLPLFNQSFLWQLCEVAWDVQRSQVRSLTKAVLAEKLNVIKPLFLSDFQGLPTVTTYYLDLFACKLGYPIFFAHFFWLKLSEDSWIPFRFLSDDHSEPFGSRNRSASAIRPFGQTVLWGPGHLCFGRPCDRGVLWTNRFIDSSPSWCQTIQVGM